MKFEESKEFIRSLIEQLCGAAVIYEKQNAPRPELPYVGIQVISHGKKGFDDKNGIDGNILYSGERYVSIGISYYGQDAMAKLNEAKNLLETETITDKCFAQGIAIYDLGEVADLTELMDSQKWEERAHLDLFYSYIENYTDTPGYFENVEITGADITQDDFSFWVKKEDLNG